MKSYSFVLNFQDEIGFFSESQVISDVRSVTQHTGFVLGKNVKNIKKITVNGTEVTVSVSLLFEKSQKDLDQAVKDVIDGLKKMKYKLALSVPKMSVSRKLKSLKKKQTRKLTIKNSHHMTRSKKKGKSQSLSTKNKKNPSWFNFFG